MHPPTNPPHHACANSQEAPRSEFDIRRQRLEEVSRSVMAKLYSGERDGYGYKRGMGACIVTYID